MFGGGFFLDGRSSLCVVEKNQNKNLPLLEIAQGAANSTNDFSDIWNEIRENRNLPAEDSQGTTTFLPSLQIKSPEITLELLDHKIYVTIFLKAIILLSIKPKNKYWVLSEKKSF